MLTILFGHLHNLLFPNQKNIEDHIRPEDHFNKINKTEGVCFVLFSLLF